MLRIFVKIMIHSLFIIISDSCNLKFMYYLTLCVSLKGIMIFHYFANIFGGHFVSC